MNQITAFVKAAFSNREVSYKSILIAFIAYQIISKLFALLCIPIFKYLPMMEFDIYRNHFFDRYALAILSLIFVNLSTGFLMGHLCKRNVYQHCFILALFTIVTESIDHIHHVGIMTFLHFFDSPGFSGPDMQDLYFSYFLIGFFTILKAPTFVLGGFLYLRTYKESQDEEDIIAEYLDNDHEEISQKP